VLLSVSVSRHAVAAAMRRARAARARGDTQGFLRLSGVPDQDAQQAAARGLPDGGAPGFLRPAAKDRPHVARHPLAERVPQLSAYRLAAAPPAARFRMTRFWLFSASAYYGSRVSSR